jgi:hypothetical protein
MSQDFPGLKISVEQQTITPSIQVQFGSATILWSTANLAFQGQALSPSTLVKEANHTEMQDTVVSFNLLSGDLSSIVFSHKLFAHTLIHDEISVLTELPIRSSEPIVNAFLSAGGCLTFKPTHLQNAVFKRTCDLIELAAEDEIEMSPSSFWDLWSFISARPTAPVPNVFALDNGNFRAVWKNSEGERIALEFRGSQIVGFVIFEYERSLGKMMRMAGSQVLSRVQAQIASAHADHLLRR